MYSNKRICPDEYKASFEDLLKEYVNIFTEDWLNSDTGHEIQKLWNRTDILASNELITLGVSIDKLKKVDPDWVKKQMNIIKTCEPNGRRGANYELILAAALHNINGQTVDLLHPQTPTYDLILNLSTGCKICISIKNFAHSKKSQEFEKEAKSIESMVKSNTQRAMQFIIRNDNFPDSGDWISLRRFLVHILKSDVNLNDNYECQYTTSKWEIILKSINVDQCNLFGDKTSYTLFITTPFHKNEEMRLYTKLNKASKDLDKNGYPETNQSINILFVRIPSVIPLKNYVSWTYDYLRRNPGSSISGFILFQPTVAYDENGSPFISLLHKVVLKPEIRENWFREKKRKCQFQFPIGVFAQEDYMTNLSINNKYICRCHYLYQSGTIYVYYDIDELLKKQKRITMHMKNTFGIHTHSIFKLGGQVGELSGNFPPNDELLLL